MFITTMQTNVTSGKRGVLGIVSQHNLYRYLLAKQKASQGIMTGRGSYNSIIAQMGQNAYKRFEDFLDQNPQFKRRIDDFIAANPTAPRKEVDKFAQRLCDEINTYRLPNLPRQMSMNAPSGKRGVPGLISQHDLYRYLLAEQKASQGIMNGRGSYDSIRAQMSQHALARFEDFLAKNALFAEIISDFIAANPTSQRADVDEFAQWLCDEIRGSFFSHVA